MTFADVHLIRCAAAKTSRLTKKTTGKYPHGDRNKIAPWHAACAFARAGGRGRSRGDGCMLLSKALGCSGPAPPAKRFQDAPWGPAGDDVPQLLGFFRIYIIKLRFWL